MILKRLTILVGVVFLVASCYQYKKPEKPENLISKDKMVDVLIDFKLISSANAANKKIMKNHGVNTRTYVFTKHDIDSLQFALSNDYYAFYSKEYEEIYTKVIDSLDALKGIYNALELKEEKEAAEAKKERDSIDFIRKRDSLGLPKIQDSLKIKMEKDSLTKTLLKKKLEEKGGLIAPVSDTGYQPQ